MARLARVIASGFPHHVIQRGNRRQQTFFSNADYRAYLELLARHCKAHRVRVWGWCLMPNHVHLILVPRDAEGLRLAVGKTHRHYTRRVNFREGWRGHLWQGRFASYPMDDAHLWQAARYVDLNPVRARLARRPENWPWSSARGRIRGSADPLLSDDCPMLQAREVQDVGDWADYLAVGLSDEIQDKFQRHERTGRPLGSADFVERLGKTLGRDLTRKKPGPKPKRGKR